MPLTSPAYLYNNADFRKANNYKNALGIFGEFPGATPKYAQNDRVGGRTDEYRNSMSRMFIQMTQAELTTFLTSLSNAKVDSSTIALAKAIAGTGTAVNGTGTGYIDFLLQSVSMQLQEKFETVEFIGDDFVTYYYGQAAPVFNFSGVLLNTMQDDQANSMFEIYRNMIRGSALARLGNALRIRYSGFLATGYANGIGIQIMGENENVCTWNMPVQIKELTMQKNLAFGTAPLNTSFQGSDLTAAPNVSGTSQVRLGVIPPKGSAADMATPSSSDVSQLGPVASPDTRPPAGVMAAVISGFDPSLDGNGPLLAPEN